MRENLEEMDTRTLERILEKIEKYRWRIERKELCTGVFSCDQLRSAVVQELDERDIAFIVNTDPITQPGTHWQALWIPKVTTNKQERTCFFFDSYGRPPQNKYIKEFIKKYTHTTIWKNQQLQSFQSVYCGEYCSVFLWSMASGALSFDDFFAKFSPVNFKKNDKQVMEWYKCTFEPSKNSTRKTIQSCKSYNNCNMKK